MHKSWAADNFQVQKLWLHKLLKLIPSLNESELNLSFKCIHNAILFQNVIGEKKLQKDYAFGYDVNELDEYGNPNVHSRTEVREGPHVKGE